MLMAAPRRDESDGTTIMRPSRTASAPHGARRGAEPLARWRARKPRSGLAGRAGGAPHARGESADRDPPQGSARPRRRHSLAAPRATAAASYRGSTRGSWASCARDRGRPLRRSAPAGRPPLRRCRVERQRGVPARCCKRTSRSALARPLRRRGEDGRADRRPRALRRLAVRRRDRADQLPREQSGGAEASSSTPGARA